MERIESEITNAEPGNSSNGIDQSGSDQGGVGARVKGVASTVRQKASTLPALIADGLEAGANALRQNKVAAVSDTGSSASLRDRAVIAADVARRTAICAALRGFARRGAA